MDHARALLDDELTRSGPRGAAVRAADVAPPRPVDVVAPPPRGSRLHRAYELLEREKLELVAELGRPHMASVIADLQDVVRAVELSRASPPDPAAALELVDKEQADLYKQWAAEVRSTIDRKLGLA